MPERKTCLAIPWPSFRGRLIMVDLSFLLPALFAKAKSQKSEALLFPYEFGRLSIRGILFSRSQTLLLGVETLNVGWQCAIENGKISEKVPNEAYRVIGDALVNDGGQRNNRRFFSQLVATLDDIAQGQQIVSPEEDDIKSLLASCRTGDRGYDKEGEKPFFDHWRRVRPSAETLQKVQRYFGSTVSAECRRNETTAVWSSKPEVDSLLFLEPAAAIQRMKALKERAGAI